VAQDGQVFEAHAAAVVLNLQILEPALLDDHADVARARVQAVFKHLLQR
jgi:hypothetical protein